MSTDAADARRPRAGSRHVGSGRGHRPAAAAASRQQYRGAGGGDPSRNRGAAGRRREEEVGRCHAGGA